LAEFQAALATSSVPLLSDAAECIETDGQSTLDAQGYLGSIEALTLTAFPLMASGPQTRYSNLQSSLAHPPRRPCPPPQSRQAHFALCLRLQHTVLVIGMVGYGVSIHTRVAAGRLRECRGDTMLLRGFQAGAGESTRGASCTVRCCPARCDGIGLCRKKIVRCTRAEW
jgi:hypothetical protein